MNLLKKIRDFMNRREINVYLYVEKRLRHPVDFCKSIKWFLTNELFLWNMEIMLAEKDILVTEEKEFVRIFIDH